jgi:hypothetical protein
MSLVCCPVPSTYLPPSPQVLATAKDAASNVVETALAEGAAASARFAYKVGLGGLGFIGAGYPHGLLGSSWGVYRAHAQIIAMITEILWLSLCGVTQLYHTVMILTKIPITP